MLKRHEIDALIAKAKATAPANFFTCDTTSLTPAEWDLRIVCDHGDDSLLAHIASGLGLL